MQNRSPQFFSILVALGCAIVTTHAAAKPITGKALNNVPRIKKARANVETKVRHLFTQAGVRYPAEQFLIRSFKREAVVEVWAGNHGEPLRRIVDYPICAGSGTLGPKRRQGDLQVPEGFYKVARFNAWSSYHLSFLVNYPNASDRILGYKKDLGGAINFHGDCVTIGCVPIEDGPIEELYIMGLDAYLKGRTVHVHMFPAKMDDAGMAWLRGQGRGDDVLWQFWQNLRPGYLYFEERRRVPVVRVDGGSGRYGVEGAQPET